MKVKIKKLHFDAIIPKYATPGAAAFDFVAIEDVEISYGETKLVKTGLAVMIPEGYELQVRPRSGTSLKTGLRVANSPGTIDSDFRGECCIVMQHAFNNLHYGRPILIKKGDRIAQGAICPVLQVEFEEVEELDETQRGVGGFGSTGSN